jgi:threonine synthase
MPKLIAVQSENCAPLAEAFFKNKTAYSNINSQPTLAEGIAIAKPVRGNQMLQYVKESKGTFVIVSEIEIKNAWKVCALKGFYI